MNKVFTKEQIAKLKEFEHDFHCVLDLKYKRNNTRPEMEKIASIYEETTNEKINKDWGCNVCQYNIVAKVGELYRKSVAYWEAEDAKSEQEMQEITKDDETVQEIKDVKPRRVYKKKKNNLI